MTSYDELASPEARARTAREALIGLTLANRYVLRALVGQYASTEGSPDALTRLRDDGSWIVEGMLPIDEFEDWLRVDVPDADEGDYQTIGGFVMARLGTIPAEADTFDWSGLHFEVLDGGTPVRARASRAFARHARRQARRSIKRPSPPSRWWRRRTRAPRSRPWRARS